MKPEPMYIVRTDNSIRNSPKYFEFDSLEEANECIEHMLDDQRLDGSGDISFSVQLYSVELGEQEDDDCFCCEDCIDCEKTANKEE